MATTTTLLSELEAVNIILAAAGEAPVQSISLSGLYPLEQAKACLNEASREVQSHGWAFNTEYEYPLTRDGSNQIPLPANVLSFDSDYSTQGSTDPIQRGLRMYDRKAHSYTFSQDLKGTVVLLLEWTDLPQPVRQLVTIVAARKMQSRMPVPQDVRRYTEDDELRARLECGQFESQVGDHNMLADSWSVGSVIFDRELIR